MREGEEPVVVVPVVGDDVQVELALVVPVVEVRDALVVVRVLPACIRYRPLHHPLNILRVESYSECKRTVARGIP